MKKIMWIIQESGGKHYNWVELMRAVKDNNSLGMFCTIDDLKNVKNNYFNIVIGGDDFLEEAQKNLILKVGIFQDIEFFNMKNYKKIWEDKFLNYNFQEIRINELGQIKPGEYFIRPLEDDKKFDGGVYRLPEDYSKICKDNIENDKSFICINKVLNIDLEWRAVIINNKLVTICQYAEKSKTNVGKNNIPKSLVEFCMKQIEFVGGPIAWIMDIALVNDEYKIIECNIFNASNYYDCNRDQIVKVLEGEFM